MSKPAPIARMMNSKNDLLRRFGHYMAYLLQYKPMLNSMVMKDFRSKFKYTFLGYFWHLLNPLIQIIVYYLLFTAIFGRDIPNYWVYISTGMFAFVFMSSCIVGGCNCIVGNKNMITKMAFAREILIFSKVLTNLITLTISYILLIVIMILTGVGVTLVTILFPIVVLCMAVFCMGVVFIFSTLTVYIRDVANVVTIVMGWMIFAIPVIYLASQRYTDTMNIIWHINPLYYYVEVIHDILYWGIVPDMFNLMISIVIAPIFLVIGMYIFKKYERGFAERL